ncbi:cAMP-regulated D2 protein [Clarias gariepinus]|uniref:cAMP-regulated D2 protein n=1 Tax=Clarias gariepinus TaxID=13013 RepID=UPI00234D9B77|nr:cAMP-regulated D2 protein [Clarias gariepinus]
MARSSGAGVTLLVLVSMAIPDLVCGGQESGKDSRLTHTHFTPHQYYTPQTGGVKSMTFQTPPRNEMLEENQYGVKSSESGNKPDAAILNSDQPQAERSRDNECNDVKCSDYGSDGASPNGVELNRVAWDKVSGNTQIRTEGPLTHSEGPLDLTHSEGPMDLTHSEGPLVLTHSGAVRGLTLDEAHVFYGIPYAAPPVGPKRWAAPETVSQWVKPYDATFPRPACMQECAREFSDACLHEVSEDCLYLNLYVPLSVDLSLRVPTRLPVMVWIHGGDFIAGSASKPLYDGRFISNYSNTLVVNMQYRLGAFGFLVTGRDPERAAVGNYGILDQQAALRWVGENIAAFGGDPTKVTLFAESAGAQSVCLHLMMRTSESLFRHATIQSQPFSIPLKSRWEAMKLGRNFVKQTNCSASDLQCLRLLSTHTVLQAQVQAGSKLINPFRFLEMFETWGPHVDGGLITEQPIAAFLQGRWQSYKPVIVGTTSEEGVSFVYGSFNSSVSALEFVLYITAIFKQHTLEVLQEYLPVYREQDRWTMLSQIVTDFMFLCPARRVARVAPRVGGDAWVYVFDHTPSDHKIWEGLTCCYRHACHGAELPFLFDSAPAANFSFTARETLLANQMVCYWGAFAHSGDPNSHGEHTPFCRNQRLAPWPKYTPAERWPVLNLTLQSHLQHQNRDGFCDFWDRLDIY